MDQKNLPAVIVEEWHGVARQIAGGGAGEFAGRNKEEKVVRRLKEVLASHTDIDFPESLRQFFPKGFRGPWTIDLVCRRQNETVALEAKFKTRSDGAVPDNRKEAFFDLFKLENYIASGKYSTGLFLWLTNKKEYLKQATGDSRDFSTHQGRTYDAQTRLHASRARRKMPLPLALCGRYTFNCHEVEPFSGWYVLSIEVTLTERCLVRI